MRVTDNSPDTLPDSSGGWRVQPGTGGIQHWQPGADAAPWQKPTTPCGTANGRYYHRKRGEATCADCRAAENRAAHERRARKKAER